MSELLGYARVSTAEQTAGLQEDALRAAGCSRIWSDTASGTRTDRPQLAALFDQLRVGDTLVVWRLDRLGRSLPHLIETIGELQARGVGFKSVQENIDTTTPGGRLVFHVFGALASFERELIQERTLAGLAAARERGRLGGRPTVLSPAKLKQARKMIGEKTPVTEVAQVLGVSRATLYRRVRVGPDPLAHRRGHAGGRQAWTPLGQALKTVGTATEATPRRLRIGGVQRRAADGHQRPVPLSDVRHTEQGTGRTPW